jgi:hypothetical protein
MSPKQSRRPNKRFEFVRRAHPTRKSEAPLLAAQARRWAENMKAAAAILVALLVTLPAHAGAWGEGSFENDDALDWVAECVNSKGIAEVAKTFDKVLNSDYIESRDGSAGVAAAEVIAAALAGQARSSRPRSVAGYSVNRFRHLPSWRLPQRRYWSEFRTRRSLSFDSFGVRERTQIGRLQWQIYLLAWANSWCAHCQQ